MSVAEIISEIGRLPDEDRRQLFRFVEEAMQMEADRLDNEEADRALAHGEFLPWDQAKKELGWE